MPDPRLDPDKLPDHAVANRDAWNADADTYQADHGPQLEKSGGMAWGVWQIPEKQLQVLGDVKGKDILEFGCGAAQWSIFLAKRVARMVGLDNSERQLHHARQRMARHGVDFPLIHASAEDVPLPDASFDLVETPTNGHHFLRLGYDCDASGHQGDAVTMVEFARDREGVMPRVLGVNHHPEVVGRNYIRNVLDSKWARGEVTKEWHDERVKTLEKHFSGEYNQQIRVTSIFTFLAPVEFHLQRLVRERREALGFDGGVDENLVILGAEAACGMEAITD